MGMENNAGLVKGKIAFSPKMFGLMSTRPTELTSPATIPLTAPVRLNLLQ